MRDRRNTNLSTSSAGSTLSSPVIPSGSSPYEKRYTSPSPEDGLLPLPVTKENTSRPLSRRTFAMRCLAALFALTWLVHWGMSCSMLAHKALSSDTSHAEADRLATHDLPNESTALVVTDGSGAQRWTVSIPPDATFPLRPGQYQDICTQAEALSSSFSQRSRLGKVKDWRRKSDYYQTDSAYLDIAEAQKTGVLPGQATTGNQTCESSMTFSMATEDVSFGKTLLLLWMSYGLAKKEGRAFFIDDTRWPYGRFTSYFTPLASPGCTPPPKSQIVPCPHNAKHIVVSPATAQWTFGPAFQAEFATSRYGLERGHHIYDLIRTGYEDLFNLIGDDEKYVSLRKHELQTLSEISGHPNIAMQIRRGDLHPLEFEYSRDYLPLERYTIAAHRLLHSIDTSRPPHHTSGEQPTLLIASDDPSLPTNHDLLLAASPHPIKAAQTRILLATKAALDISSPANPIRAPGSAYVKHVDENAGWDGGFYTSMFNSLGGINANSQGTEPSDQVMRMRELIGRGYLLDLAVLSASDGVVCAVGSAACRLAGVMMGWDAVAEGRWANVDDGRGWSWDGRR